MFRIILTIIMIRGESQRPFNDGFLPAETQKLLQVPCYEDALNMILDFDDQDDGTSEIHRANLANCPNKNAYNKQHMVGETHQIKGILRI